MAQQWGDPNRVRNQIDSARAEGNRNIAIEANGWKNQLADSLAEYGLQAQKEAYLDRVRAEKQTYDKGVLEAANTREDTLTTEKRAYDQPKTDALIAESAAKAAKYNAEAANVGDKIPKMSKMDELKYKRYDTISNSLTASTEQKNDALAKMDEIERRNRGGGTPTPPTIRTPEQEARAKELEGKGPPITSVMDTTSTERFGPPKPRQNYPDKSETSTEALNRAREAEIAPLQKRVDDIKQLLKEKTAPKNTIKPLTKEMKDLEKKIKKLDSQLRL